MLGERMPRVEDIDVVCGRARYIADVDTGSRLHAVFVRSPVAHAHIRVIDTEEARGQPGVVTVLIGRDLPHHPLVDSVGKPGLSHTPQPAIAGDRVRFAGEPVALVVAATRAAAEDAAAFVDVDYDELPVLVDPQEALERTDAVLLDGARSNIIYDETSDYGDVAEAFARAAHTVSARYVSNRYAASPMEPRGCVAIPEASGRLTLYASTQSPNLLQRKVAASVGISEGKVRVITPDVGGAFGVKIPASPEEIAVVLAARHLQRPVSWIEERSEHLASAPHAKDQIIDLELALDQNGTFLGIRGTILGDTGAYSYNSASALIEPHFAAMMMPGPYRIGAIGCRVMSVLTNKAPIAPYRGVGWTAGHSARELLIERAAAVCGQDSADLRRANLIRSDEYPYRSATGMCYDSGSCLESFDRALEIIGYHNRRAPGTGTTLRGIGVSPYVEPGGWGSEGAAESDWSFASFDSVQVRMLSSGEVVASVGTPSQGQGSETTLAQVVAAELGVPVNDVAVVSRDTATVPPSAAGTRASRTAVISGGAVAAGARTLTEKLRHIAAAKFECAPADVEVNNGHAYVIGSHSTSATLQELAQAAYFDLRIRESVTDPDLVATEFYDPPATYSNGCVAVAVEVDPETCNIRVVDAAAVEDCGTMINPAVIEGQVAGAIAQGIGGAMFEQIAYDENGQTTGTSFADYYIPSAKDIPSMSFDHYETPSPLTANGVKGMGESGLIATPAAVLIAITDALKPLNVMPAQTPVTPQYLYDLINARSGT
jgi:carbon-monoxide dehydrogenase large subunit